MGANDVEVLCPIHGKVILVEENLRRQIVSSKGGMKDISAD